MVLYSHIDSRQQALPRAWMSFVGTVTVIMIAFAVVAPDRWFGSTDPEAVVGTFVVANQPAADVSGQSRQFAQADYALRLMENDRAEVRVDGTFIDAYYRVEKNRVMVETADARGGNQAWSFKVDGDRLVQGNLVLHRAGK